MKRYVLISLLAFAACNSNKNVSGDHNDPNSVPTSMVNNPHSADGIDNVAASMKPTMDFKDTVHDFGQMHEDEVTNYDFAFTNNGKSPLIITSATGSCGCTVASYPHDAIAPGKSDVMKVTFNSAGKSGHQEKSVVIHTNTLRGIHMLYIKSEIAAKKE